MTAALNARPPNMTERERLAAVLDGKVPDRTPWYGDLSWWHAAHEAAGDLHAGYAGEAGYLRLHRDSGVGIYLYAPMLWTQTYDDTVTQTSIVEGRTVTSMLITPVGSVRCVTVELPGSGASAVVEHYVKGPDDLRVMRYAHAHRRIVRNYDAFVECERRWGNSGMACALAPVSTTGLQMLLTRWAGVETAVRLWADARPEFERTIGEVQDCDDAIFALLASAPTRYVVFPENLSGEVTGRRLLRQYAMPYWRKRIDQLHSAGKLVGIHNDGTLRASLPLLIEAGFDFVEAATPAPVGDMALDELRDMTADRILVWGGIPGALFSPTTSEECFETFVEQVLRTFPRGSAFVLGVADQVPPDATFERICLVREIVERTG